MDDGNGDGDCDDGVFISIDAVVVDADDVGVDWCFPTAFEISCRCWPGLAGLAYMFRQNDSTETGAVIGRRSHGALVVTVKILRVQYKKAGKWNGDRLASGATGVLL